MNEKELETLLDTVADIECEVRREAADRCRRTRRGRTAAYLLALLLVGAGTAAALPAHRYDYVLGAHASHPDVAYHNTMVMLQSL